MPGSLGTMQHDPVRLPNIQPSTQDQTVETARCSALASVACNLTSRLVHCSAGSAALVPIIHGHGSQVVRASQHMHDLHEAFHPNDETPSALAMLRSPALDMLASVDLDTDSEAEELVRPATGNTKYSPCHCGQEKNKFFQDEPAQFAASPQTEQTEQTEQAEVRDGFGSIGGTGGPTAAGEVHSER